MTTEQLEMLNSAVAELVRTYREYTATTSTQEIIAFEENHPLADLLEDLEFYVDEAGLLG